jgi:hypothetical protein
MAVEEIHIPRKLVTLVRASMRETHCQIGIQNMLSAPLQLEMKFDNDIP